MKEFWFIFDKVIDFMAYLAGVILLFVTGAVCYTIGLRFLFKMTTIWIIPIAEYSLLWIVFLGTTWLLREKGHITTDILFVHLKERIQHYLSFIMFIIGGMSCIVLLFLGIIHLAQCIAGRVTDVRAITVPKAAVFIIIPIGSLLLSIQFFRMAWASFVKIKTGE